MINEFRGKYYFLSNFYYSHVTYKDITYENNESAFQAQKTNNESLKLKFRNLDPSSAKRLGRKVDLRKDWEQVKDQIMYEICKGKFEQHVNLEIRLLATSDEYLEEGNTWGDKEWGTVNGEGQNKLGKILMRVREELRDKQ